MTEQFYPLVVAGGRAVVPRFVRIKNMGYGEEGGDGRRAGPGGGLREARKRLRQAGDWYRWGPYLSERQWGTVREDYSADGDAWNYLPHDQARSRAYRWGEDGLAGFCDIEQRLCLALALWNGRDPILKERAFGMSSGQGNHGVARLFSRLFDESEFLSPHGLRALSAYHRSHPYVLSVEGVTASVDYEPAESTTPLFGGNSNWRGPVWFPLKYLMITALERYHRFFGDDFTIEYPTGSGNQLTLDRVTADLQDWLISIFTRGPDGRRPCFGGTSLLQDDPAWRDNVVFGEYFHGDNGAALGASHQTGWTGLIADIIRRRYGLVRSIGDVITLVGEENQA